MLVPAGEEEAAEQVLRVGPRQPGHRLDALEHGAALVELDLLLREVGGIDAVPEPRRAAVAVAPPEHRLEQRRLPGPVRPDERDVLAALERERDAVQQLLLAGRQREPLDLDDRAAAARRVEELEAEPPCRRVSSATSLGARRLAPSAAGRSASASPAPASPSTSWTGTAPTNRSSRAMSGSSRATAFRAWSARAAFSRRHACHGPAKYVERPASSSSTAVVTASRNQRSCATRMTAASSAASSRSSHSRFATSRWFVGSSRSSRSGSPPSARASEARVSSPPENVSSAAVEVLVREAEPAHDASACSRQA